MSSPELQNASSSDSLLIRIQRQEPAAWNRFVDLYAPLVFSWGRRNGLGHEDAADIVQEVMASAARAIHRFRPKKPNGTLRAWLWKIARNKLYDLHRRGNRSPVSRGGTSFLLRLQQIPDEWSDDSDQASCLETHQLVRRCLEAIRNDFEQVTWEAFWRSTILEQEAATIARDLGISSNAVRQYKSRVLRRLRCELGDQME